MIFKVVFFVFAAVSAASAGISEVAPPGFAPHHAGVFGLTEGVLDPNVTVYNFLCSGAIISPELVLTTASCVDQDGFYSKKGYAVLVGQVNTSADDLVYTQVQEVRKHFSYVKGERNADIAVLKLGVGLTLSENVQSIAVRNLSPVTVGADCTISGWRTDMLTVSSVLRYSNLTVLDKTACEEAGDGEICTGSATETDGDLCQIGEEASPVSCDGLLTGILHYSYDLCLFESAPVVLGDVYYHEAWINSQLATESAQSTISSSSTTLETSSTEASTTTSETSTASSTTPVESTSTESTTSTSATEASSTPVDSSSTESTTSTSATEASSTSVDSSSTESTTSTSATETSLTSVDSSSTESTISTSATETSSTSVDSSSTESTISTSATEASSTSVDSSSTESTTSTSATEASTTSVDSSSTESTTEASTPEGTTTAAQQLTTDHPTGEICFGNGASLTSSLITVLLLAAVIGIIQ